MRRFLYIGLVLICSGCAALRPRIFPTTFGSSDPARDKVLAETAEDMPDTPQDVVVKKGEIPAGVDITENGSKIVIAPEASGQYQTLGSIEADYMAALNEVQWRNLYWTHDYRSWRSYLCNWQIPLKIASLGIWSVLSPLHWPCLAKMPGDVTDRQIALTEAVKKGAKAMGGDLVVISSSTQLDISTSDQYGRMVGFSSIKDAALKGFVLKTSK